MSAEEFPPDGGPAGDGKTRSLVRIIALDEDLAYCLFPILGYGVAIAIPRRLVGDRRPPTRFFVRMKVPNALVLPAQVDRAPVHKRLCLSDFEFDL